MAFNRLHILHLAIAVQQMTALHYEQGRQDRSYKNVWRNHINPTFHIGYRTFLKYLNMNAERELRELQELRDHEKIRAQPPINK